MISKSANVREEINRAKFLWERTDAAAILLGICAFLYFVFLARNYPVLYWGDAHVRLALHDKILLGHWLPLFQILLSMITALTNDLLVVRGFLALIACSALACFYYLAKTVFTPATGIVAMMILATNSIFVALAIVPYTESLFIGLTLLAFLLLHPSASTRQLVLGAIVLNLACLTRYEGWLLSLVLIVESAALSWKARKVSGFAKAAIASSIAPLGWLIFIMIQPGDLGIELGSALTNIQVLMTGSADSQPSIFSKLVIIGSFLKSYSQLLLAQMKWWFIVLGITGWLIALFKPAMRALSLRILAFTILVFLMWLGWSSVSVWDSQNFALRTAFISETFLIFFAAYGIHQLISRLFSSFCQAQSSHQVQYVALVGAVVMLSIPSVLAANQFVSQSSRTEGFSIPAHIGSWLNSRIEQRDSVLILSDDLLQPYALATYTSLPFGSILDDRLDDQTIQHRINLSNRVFIICLFNYASRLSENETKILTGLEDGSIPADNFDVSGKAVWIVSDEDMIEFLYAK